MRQAILEGINLSRPPPPPPPLPPPAFLPPTMVPPFYPMPPLYPPRPMGGMPPHHHPHHPHHPAQHRPRAFPGLLVTLNLFFMILWPHLTVIITLYLRELKSFNINSGFLASGISGSLREHSFILSLVTNLKHNNRIFCLSNAHCPLLCIIDLCRLPGRTIN